MWLMVEQMMTLVTGNKRWNTVTYCMNVHVCVRARACVCACVCDWEQKLKLNMWLKIIYVQFDRQGL